VAGLSWLVFAGIVKDVKYSGMSVHRLKVFYDGFGDSLCSTS